MTAQGRAERRSRKAPPWADLWLPLRGVKTPGRQVPIHLCCFAMHEYEHEQEYEYESEYQPTARRQWLY